VPIYEFFCADCNTIFNFFSPVPNTETRPSCPKCKRPDLKRRVSRFATLKHKGEEEPTPFDGFDEGRMEKAMEALAGEMEGLEGHGGAEDPRSMARFMRKFTQLSGMEAGPKMEEMLKRLEAGEDPEAMEKEMGAGEMDDDEAMSEFFKMKKAVREKSRKPKEDETLYFL
jgi:putative FmdB family regulatory protein